VLSYLKDFLFTPDRAQQPVSALSGGERNRLLLARLFTQPANLLVLGRAHQRPRRRDPGTARRTPARLRRHLLLVSHDRDLLDNVVTSTLVLEGDGQVGDYVGGYSDWLRQRPVAAVDKKAQPKSEPKSAPEPSRATPVKPVAKLSYKDQRELEQLPKRIEDLEQEQQALHQRMADPALYRGDGSEVTAVQARLAELEAELARSYARWEALEG
jgi:ATP-binding cassette subfamily F protein uup